MRVAIYARVSTGEQSPELQLRELRAICHPGAQRGPGRTARVLDPRPHDRAVGDQGWPVAPSLRAEPARRRRNRVEQGRSLTNWVGDRLRPTYPVAGACLP
jgi:hypothetical protein